MTTVSAAGNLYPDAARQPVAEKAHWRPPQPEACSTKPLVWEARRKESNWRPTEPPLPRPLSPAEREKGENSIALRQGTAREARPLRARITRPPPPKPLGEVELQCYSDPRLRGRHSLEPHILQSAKAAFVWLLQRIHSPVPPVAGDSSEAREGPAGCNLSPVTCPLSPPSTPPASPASARRSARESRPSPRATGPSRPAWAAANQGSTGRNSS